MNREIKFRGRRLDNGEWAVGHLVKMWNEWHILAMDDTNTAYPVDPDTIGEYTGLKDKNGREIYEGDIMNLGRRKDRIGYIGYSEVHPAFMFVIRHDDFVLYSRNSERQYEVLGNIYDNPEVLKVGRHE